MELQKNEHEIWEDLTDETLEKNNNLSLIKGEKILTKFENLILQFPQMKVSSEGNLWITNCHLIFVPKNVDQDSVIVPLSCIGSLTFNTEPQGYSVYLYNVETLQVTIKTRDVRSMTLTFKNTTDRNKLITIVEEYSFWKKKGSASRFFGLNNPTILETIYPQCIYDIDEELKRLNISETHEVNKCNENYEICSTYPKYVILPKNVQTELISQSAAFRSNKRFPAVCWIHPQTKAAIARCSQPLNGFAWDFGKNGKNGPNNQLGDHVLMKKICCPNPKLFIVDARSMIAAKFNMAKGGGHENPVDYNECEIKFMDIANIHQVRKSYVSLSNLCHQIDSPTLLQLEQTGWSSHIKAILEASNSVVKYIETGINVLVHCSDGWDRTTQLVSLAQLLMDPYFRTIEGFGKLIQKEWISFGHKFEERIGYGEPEDASQEISPIFLQFINAVYQIMTTEQYEEYFEFNEQYLIALLDQIYSGQFVTFLYNSEKERQDIHDNANILWSWFLQPENQKKFRNPNYVKEINNTIEAPTTTAHFHFWKGYYERYRDSMKNYNEYKLHKIERENLKKQQENDEQQKKFDQLLQLLQTQPSLQNDLQELLANSSNKEVIININVSENGELYLKLHNNNKEDQNHPRATKEFDLNKIKLVEDYLPNDKGLNNNNTKENNLDEESFLQVQFNESEWNNYMERQNNKSGILNFLQNIIRPISIVYSPLTNLWKIVNN